MRTSIVFAVAAALASLVTGCASTPVHYAAAADVPMYTQAEWVAMNTDHTVPEIAVDEVGSDEGAIASTVGYSGIGGARFHAFGASSAFSGTSSFGSFGSFGGFGRGSISAGSSHGASGFSAGHASMGGGHGGGGHGGGHGGR